MSVAENGKPREARGCVAVHGRGSLSPFPPAGVARQKCKALPK